MKKKALKSLFLVALSSITLINAQEIPENCYKHLPAGAIRTICKNDARASEPCRQLNAFFFFAKVVHDQKHLNLTGPHFDQKTNLPYQEDVIEIVDDICTRANVESPKKRRTFKQAISHALAKIGGQKQLAQKRPE